VREVISGVLVLIGAAFMLLAGVGILRMPDLYTRMSATTKVATLGVGSTLLAVAVYFGELGIVTRALAAVAFVLLTAPVAAHMIGRASYFIGVPLCRETAIDELRGHYDLRTHELESVCFPELELQLPDHAGRAAPDSRWGRGGGPHAGGDRVAPALRCERAGGLSGLPHHPQP